MEYCERAADLMSETEQISPYATEVLRKGLTILNRKLNSLLEEIREKAKTGLAIGFGKRWVDGRRGVFGYVVQEAALAIRIPVGLTYMIPRTPLEAGLEIAPLLILGPEAGWGFDGGTFESIPEACSLSTYSP